MRRQAVCKGQMSVASFNEFNGKSCALSLQLRYNFSFINIFVFKRPNMSNDLPFGHQ